MSTRSLVAFVVGAAVFSLEPLFDSVLPDDRPDAGNPVWIALGGAAAVGALVALIAGDPRAWLLAAAGALVGALLSLVHVAASGPPFYPDDSGAAYAASGVLYFFAFTGPPAALGGLAAGLAFDLLGDRIRRHSSYRSSRR